MILVPFIFFSLLTAYLWWRHQCFDVCVYMSSLYTFTSLMAIILVIGDLLEEGGILFDAYDIQLSPIPTLLYCGFITIGIIVIVGFRNIDNIGSIRFKLGSAVLDE